FANLSRRQCVITRWRRWRRRRREAGLGPPLITRRRHAGVSNCNGRPELRSIPADRQWAARLHLAAGGESGYWQLGTARAARQRNAQLPVAAARVRLTGSTWSARGSRRTAPARPWPPARAPSTSAEIPRAPS